MRFLREYRIRLLGREMIEYREGEVAFVFIAGWGVKPPVLYVPRPDAWERVMPAKFRGRREQIVERLKRDWYVRSHVLEDSDY